MKLEHMEELAIKDDYAKNLLEVLSSIVDEAVEKLVEDYLENKESVILKKIFPRYNFMQRDPIKFEKFEKALFGVVRRFSPQTIERLAKSDVNSQEYKMAYRKIATFFSRETKISQKQPKTFSGADMENLFNGLVEKIDGVNNVKSPVMEL